MNGTRQHRVRMKIFQFTVLCACLLLALTIGHNLLKSAADMNISGNWNYSDSHGAFLTMTIIQSSAAAIIGIRTDGTTFSGLVNGKSISMVFSHATNSGMMTLKGTISSNTNSMSGIFTNSLAARGTWSAVRLKQETLPDKERRK